jgi:transposase
MKKIKTYSAEEKTKVAMEAIKGDLTIAQITSKYGVHASVINRWKQEAIKSIVSGFKTKSKDPDNGNDHLVKELYQQIGQLTVERDWLKKKSSIFGFSS